MSAFLAQYGIQTILFVVLACYNVLGTAVVTVLQKVEDAFAPGDAKIEGVKSFIGKTAGWAASIGDWLLGNKAH